MGKFNTAIARGVMGVYAPVALPTAILLGLLGVGVDEAVFGEVLRDVIFGTSSTISEAGVVAVVGLVGSSH
jgi:hypothetical protein